MGGKSKTAFSLHFKVKFVNMNKVNYQKVLEQIIEKNERENRVPTLLLHSCCAPCSSYCLEYLSNYFKITVFYYNPNIYPEEEYRKRVAEQQKFIEKLPVKYPIHFVEGAYEKERFYEMAKGLEDCPEGGERCFLCYELRLREAAELAKKMQMDYFTTTLSISPLKNAEKLNEIGDALAEEYGIAREIKDGKFTGKVFSPIVLTGYVPDLLKSISMMSDKCELAGTGYCGKGHKEWVKVSDGGPYIKARIRLG